MLVTGRRYPAARRMADELGGPLDLVLHNGALIVENGTVLRCRPLDRTVARRVIALGRAAGADPVVHAGRGGEGLLLVEGAAKRASPVLGALPSRRKRRFAEPKSRLALECCENGTSAKFLRAACRFAQAGCGRGKRHYVSAKILDLRDFFRPSNPCPRDRSSPSRVRFSEGICWSKWGASLYSDS